MSLPYCECAENMPDGSDESFEQHACADCHNARAAFERAEQHQRHAERFPNGCGWPHLCAVCTETPSQRAERLATAAEYLRESKEER